MKTTLNQIRNNPSGQKPCVPGWEKLLKHLGKTKADDEPLSFLNIFDSNGFNDTIWVLDKLTGHDRELRLFAVWCARRVQHLMKDQRSLDALDVAQRFAEGQATEEELAAAWAAAWDAAWAAWAAWDAAWAAWAAWVARESTQVTWAAAQAAAEALRDDAWEAAWVVERAVVRAKTCEASKSTKQPLIAEFRRLLECIENGVRYEID